MQFPSILDHKAELVTSETAEEWNGYASGSRGVRELVGADLQTIARLNIGLQEHPTHFDEVGNSLFLCKCWLICRTSCA